VEGRSFTVYTDHKPLVYAFHERTAQCSPRQFRHLDFIGQFTTDIRHVSGEDNVVADALSRVEEVERTLDFEAWAAAQHENEELQQYLEEDSPLLMKKVRIPDTDVAVFCDVSTQTVRPFVTKEFRKAAFD